MLCCYFCTITAKGLLDVNTTVIGVSDPQMDKEIKCTAITHSVTHKHAYPRLLSSFTHNTSQIRLPAHWLFMFYDGKQSTPEQNYSPTPVPVCTHC